MKLDDALELLTLMDSRISLANTSRKDDFKGEFDCRSQNLINIIMYVWYLKNFLCTVIN